MTSKRRRRRSSTQPRMATRPVMVAHTDPQRMLDRATRLAETGEHAEAKALYEQLSEGVLERRLQAIVANDLGVLAYASGEVAAARQRFEQAIAFDKSCDPARANLHFVDKEEALVEQPEPPDRGPVGLDSRKSRAALQEGNTVAGQM